MSDFFPHVLPPNLMHVLVVTEERTFVIVDIIATCLTSALVLEGLDDVGDLNNRALKRTPVLFVVLFVSIAVLLLVVACQNAKRASNHSGPCLSHHHTVSLP